MSERNDISGLLGFIGSEHVWRERLQDVVAEHLMPALEEFEVDHDELSDLLGEQWSGVLWGCGFEDFFGRQFSSAVNMVRLRGADSRRQRCLLGCRQVPPPRDVVARR